MIRWIRRMCTKPLPKWYYKYFVEYDENEKANHGIIYDKSFEELMRIHKDVKKGDNFSKEYYNEANIFSLYGNFFEYFCKSMKCIEDDRILLEQIRFLEYLLNIKSHSLRSRISLLFLQST